MEIPVGMIHLLSTKIDIERLCCAQHYPRQCGESSEQNKPGIPCSQGLETELVMPQ